MGYEIAEQLGWELPDVIIYPTGGGTGLVGMWKAFQEMEELGVQENLSRFYFKRELTIFTADWHKATENGVSAEHRLRSYC